MVTLVAAAWNAITALLVYNFHQQTANFISVLMSGLY